MADSFYRREIYLIQTLMRGCLWYGLCILFSFYAYQQGKGEFHPVLFLSVFPEILILWSIRFFVKNRKLGVFALLAAVVCEIGFLPTPWLVIVPEFFLQLFSYFEKGEDIRRFGVFWETWLYQPPGVILFMAVMLFHNFWSGRVGNRSHAEIPPEYAGRCILAAFGIFLVFYILNYYMKNFHDHFLGQKKVFGKEAFARAKRSNYAMLFILLLVGALAMFLFTFLPMGLYSAILNGIKQFFARLLGLTLSSMEQLGTGGEGTLENSGMSSGPMESAEPVKVGAGAGKLIGILFIIGIVLGLAWLLVKFFKSVLVSYSAGTDTAEFISIREEEDRVYEEKGKFLFRKKFGNTNREQVRKAYYQTILKRFGRMSKERKASVRMQQTPAEWSSLFAVSPNDREKLKELTAYYEKARFAQEDCTEEDVEAARRLQD